MSASQQLNILGICGSLRKSSYNMMALKVAGQLMPEGMHLSIAEIGDLPLYNQDVFDKGLPESAVRLRAAIKAADGVLIASPEYNFSITGVLKNAIDWASRPPEQPFLEKPAAILSATTGPLGGARSQYDLRKILLFLNAHTLIKPEIFINAAQTKFAADGSLNDEATRKFVGDQMVAFAKWIKRMRVEPTP